MNEQLFLLQGVKFFVGNNQKPLWKYFVSLMVEIKIKRIFAIIWKNNLKNMTFT